MPSLRNLCWDLVDTHVADGRGARVAVREPRRAWSYVELQGEVRKAATGLRMLSLRPGKRVGLLMHDSADFAAVFLAALRIGAIPVPLSPLLQGRDVVGLLNDAKPMVVVAHADLVPTVTQVQKELARRPALVPLSEFDALAETTAPGDHPDFVDEHAPVMLLYGDASGEARGVTHDAAAVRAGFDAWRRVFGLDAGDRVFSTSGLASADGLAVGLLFPLMAGATACVLPERPRPRAVFDGIAHFHPTVFYGAGSHYRQMIEDAQQEGGGATRPLAGVRVVASCSEPLPDELHRRAADALGAAIVDGEGAAETLPFYLHARSDGSGAMGELMPGFEARIVDAAGRPVRATEIGELELRGPSVARGHWRVDPGPGSPFRDGGWFRTGARCFADADGRHYACGRVDDRFRVMGRWVSPEEIESLLVGHASVWQCAVVGERDSDGLTIPVAYVVPNVGHAPSDELGRDIIAFVKGRSSPHKYPRRISFVEELPRDGSGRVERWRLATGKTAPA